MSDRANQLISDILRRIHEAIVENDVTYEEYQAAKQWFIDVGEAGEWPLFGDVYIEHVVEEQAFGNRAGSQGTILGPFHLPDAPVLDAPFELPHRPDEPGDRTVVSGRVTDADGNPLADANLDVWQADAEGRYSSFMPGPPEGNLRGQVRTDADGRYEVRTVVPGPYTIPLDGPTGKMTAAAGWSPWRPAHIHLIVSADGYEPLVTQLFIDSSDHLDNDVASAVKPELIVHPRPRRTRTACSNSPTTSPSPPRARRRPPEARSMPGLKVAVVGGGIGGLVLALALRERGIDFEVYEQADELREVGAAVALSANATRELRRLGLGERWRPSRWCPRPSSSGAGTPATSSPTIRWAAAERTRRRSARPTTACIASRCSRRWPTDWAPTG